MSIFDIFRPKPWSLEPLSPPWKPLPSIYDHIVAHIDATTGSLPERYMLPDDDVVNADGGIRWAAGAMDGVLGHHSGAEDAAELRVRQVLKAIEDLLKASTDANLRHLYELTIRDNVLSIVDGLLRAIAAKRDRLDAERLHVLARYLAQSGGHREIVKLGIALLGAVSASDDLALLMTLGTCEELTLFVSVAICNQAPDDATGLSHLFVLAKRVHSWGRIQLVERLATTSDPETRDWLLREGYKNDVMYEYLACICARAGELSKALTNPDIDDALLLSAGALLASLVSGCGGPAEGMDDYEDASRAVASYLGQLSARRPQHVQHFITADVLRDYLSDAEGWSSRPENGFNENHRNRCLSIADDVLAWPEWRELAIAAQASSDRAIAWKGDVAAKRLGIDSWAHHRSKVESEGVASVSWYRLLEESDASRIDAVVSIAERMLPLDEIAVGPRDEHGFGLEFSAHDALSTVVDGLCRHPGKGVVLVRAALRSPVQRNRFGALRALSGWGETAWPEGTREMLEEAERAEPVEHVKEAIVRVRRGEPLEIH